MPKKFGIDKRIIHLSAQLMSGLISRDAALEELRTPPLSENELMELKLSVLKLLKMSDSEFEKIMHLQNRTYKDYPNNEKMLKTLIRPFSFLMRRIYSQKPMTFIEMEVNKK